jgi:hypothetical protein
VVGVSISGDRRTVLSIGLVYRGQAIPVAWKVLLATVLHPWEPEWRALVRGFSGAVAPGHMPIVLTDRTLYARSLCHAIRARADTW